jgi:hypothetical protein
MRDIADNVEKETREQECCTEGCGCGSGACDIEDCALGCNDGDCGDLERARAQFEREYREELARLQKRVAELEEQGRAHASRQICALMTEVDSLERNVLGRDVTTSQLKKAGMQILGVDKKP